VETCAEGDAADCGPVLMTDMAVKCWAGDHLLAAAFAAVVLVLVALVIPAVLLRDANSGGQGGHAAPLASRLHTIPTHFLLNLHGI
jgi:hypothetical protein